MTALVIAPACVLGLALVAAPAGASVSDRSPGLARGDRAGGALAAPVPHRPSPVGQGIVAMATAGPQALPVVGPPPTQIVGPAIVYGEYYDDFVTSPTYRLLLRDLRTGSVSALSYLDPQCPDELQASPNGKQVVFRDWGLDCSGTITMLLLDLPTGTLTTIATAPANAWFEFPNWSPDGSKILYTQLQDDSQGTFLSSQLYTIPPAGGSPTAITGGGVNGEDGAYSPDGTKIVYSAAVDTTANYLAIMNSDGTGVLNLTSTAIGEYSPMNPAWSPDGSKISYTYFKPYSATHVLNRGMAVVNANGSGNHTLAVTTNASWNGWTTSWSADSSEIFFDGNVRSATTGDVLTNSSIYATDTNGKQRTTVVLGRDNTVTGAYNFDFSPSFVGPGPDTGTASTYVPVTPTRIVTQTPLGQGATMSVQVAGGSSPVPADATAVTLNLTGVSPTHATYLQAYPKVLGSSAVPKVSNLNLSQGQKAAVAVQVAVGSGGNVVIRNAFGTVGVIADVSGYFVAGTGGAGYAPLTVPSRAYDGTLVGKSSHTVDLSGLAPTGAVAAVVNLTAANPSQTTYLAVTPDPVPAGSNPTVSNLNLPAHATRANLVTVPLSAGGTVSVFNYTGSVRAIVDVSGFYTSQAGHLAYYPLTPTRVLDTRYATNTYLGSTAPIGSGRTYYFTLGQTTTTADGIVTVPAGAQAVAYNVTAVLPTANTYLTVYGDPTTNARPTASNLNLAAGTTVPNMVIAALPANRLIGIYNLTGSTPVLADLNGYYAP